MMRPYSIAGSTGGRTETEHGRPANMADRRFDPTAFASRHCRFFICFAAALRKWVVRFYVLVNDL